MDIQWIRDKLKLLGNILRGNEPAFITLEMIDEYIETLQTDIIQTRQDLLEVSKGLVLEASTVIYCENCKEWKEHLGGCPVLKAEKIIKELENE